MVSHLVQLLSVKDLVIEDENILTWISGPFKWIKWIELAKDTFLVSVFEFVNAVFDGAASRACVAFEAVKRLFGVLPNVTTRRALV